MKLLELISDRPYVISLGSIVIALAVMAAGVVLCVKMTEKRDY
jgi:multisubunit Na+/H+ antiporter MnhC subunit